MALEWRADRLYGVIDPGGGSAPELIFEGEEIKQPEVSGVFSHSFSSYEDYARWVIDQHLSLTIWPTECVVQDMHLDFQGAKIIPLRSLSRQLSGPDFSPDEFTFLDSFAVEGLKVFLDKIYAVRMESKRI